MKDPLANSLTSLQQMLRPAGGGLYTVSTGRKEQIALQMRLYGARKEEEIEAQWKACLASFSQKKIALIGVPSDVGAGYRRGSNFAPQAIREKLLSRKSALLTRADFVDLGDIFIVPQFLHDTMLSAEQLGKSRQALYNDAKSPLPVSPLSLLEKSLDLLYAINPTFKPLLLGGDHSLSIAAVSAVSRQLPKEKLGILHFDAHTDLLAERLGVKYTYGSWAYHANDLIGQKGRLVQIGIRTSSKPKSYWESELGVKQLWSNEVAKHSEKEICEEVVRHFKQAGIGYLYISNDIDATDPAFAAATGTPEADGLTPKLVTALISRISKEFPVVGSDLVEVAPALAHEKPGEPDRTLETACLYLETMAAALA